MLETTDNHFGHRFHTHTTVIMSSPRKVSSSSSDPSKDDCTVVTPLTGDNSPEISLMPPPSSTASKTKKRTRPSKGPKKKVKTGTTPVVEKSLIPLWRILYNKDSTLSNVLAWSVVDGLEYLISRPFASVVTKLSKPRWFLRTPTWLPNEYLDKFPVNAGADAIMIYILDKGEDSLPDVFQFSCVHDPSLMVTFCRNTCSSTCTVVPHNYYERNDSILVQPDCSSENE